MKRIILSLLFATAAFGQISVQKKQDGSNQISNGPVVVGSNNSITATGTGIIAATAIPSISIITAAPLTGGAALTGNLTLAIPQSSGSVNGYLSSGDWTIFNTKQPAGNYMTALTGDGSAAGPGSAVFTLTTVLGSPGGVGTATDAPVVTFDAKGRATATSTVTITPALGSITGLGTGVAAFLATPSSANLATAITDETGTGALVFGTSPTLVTPHFGSIVNTGTLTLPTLTDTLIGRATTDVLTNKSISGSTNTLTNIPNSALTNQGITLGTTVVNLGGTITSLAGINSITAASGHDYVAQGGDNGASLTLGQGANGAATLASLGSGYPILLHTGAATSGLDVFARWHLASTGTTAVGFGGVAQFRLQNASGAITDAADFGALWTNATAGTTAADLFWRTGINSNLTEKMRLTSGGNLLIGTTTDISGSGGLSVAGAIYGGGVVQISGSSITHDFGATGTNRGIVKTGANASFANVAAISLNGNLTDSGLAGLFGGGQNNTYVQAIAGGSVVVRTNGNTIAATFDASQNTALAGSLSLAANATIQPSSTGYLVVSSNGNNLYLDAPPVGGHVYQRVNSGTIISDVSSAGLALTGNLTATGILSANSGSFSGAAAPAAGASLELIYSSNTGTIQAYDRTGVAYKTAAVAGSTVLLQPNGSTQLTASTTGVIVAGNLTIGGALKLGNAYAAGVTTATGTLDLEDSTGTTYHMLVHN